MPVLEGCKHSVEIEVPESEVQQETERVTSSIQKRAQLPGFRPGKAPVNLIKTRFSESIRQEVLEHLLPKAFRQRAESEGLKVVGTPNVTDVHYHDNHLKFTAEFEVFPEFELGEYRNIPVEYEDPNVSDDEMEKRLESLRERKADYVNQDARAIEDGDYAVVHLKSTEGTDEAIDNDDMMLHIGDPETMPEFSEGLRGATPGETREIEVQYPEDYARESIAGKKVKFNVEVKGLRKKEVPELNDEFARDLGDFQTVDELRDAIRKSILAEKTFESQRTAKDQAVDELVKRHEFPVPEAWIEKQTEATVENRIRTLAQQGIDPRNLKLDWNKVRENHREQAIKDVKASLLVERVADAESIHATQEEIDRELQRFSKEQREPVAALRSKFEKDGTLGRIANHIRTEKTLNFLFENAQKRAKAETPAEPAAE